MKNKLFTLAFILVACSNSHHENLDNKGISESFFRIDIENTEAIQKIEYLSDLASEIDYTQLETNKDCILNRGAKFLITDVSLRSSAYFSFCGGWIIFSQNNNL